MKALEDAWTAHQKALAGGDLAALLATLAAGPSVLHLPAMTGASGRQAVERF